MQMNTNDRYLFWFESEQSTAKIDELNSKLIELGVKFEIINGLKKPAIIKFGEQPQKSVIPVQPTWSKQ